MFIKLLLWIGLVARKPNGHIAWPIRFAPRWVFRDWNSFQAWCRMHGPAYRFRNLPGVIKWVPGRLLPRRWGFGIFGLIEIGDRGH